jgi:hypothetical protein
MGFIRVNVGFYLSTRSRIRSPYLDELLIKYPSHFQNRLITKRGQNETILYRLSKYEYH